MHGSGEFRVLVPVQVQVALTSPARWSLQLMHSHPQRLFSCLAAVAAFLISCWAGEALAQRLDTFEGGSPRWRLVESDCNAQIVGQEISPTLPHSGRTSELIDVSCTAGQMALLAYPIEPCAVINEFQPGIWLRCASGQLRLGVRVVYPNALHPISHSRMTSIIWGEGYSQPGQWQRLQVRELGSRLQQEIIGIRNQFQQPLDLDKAYIDALVVNVYTGPGRTRVQLDDLDIGTMIPLASVGVPLPANWRERWNWRDDAQAQFGSAKSIPIWIENRGEQPAWLQSLGFNGVLLHQLPSPSQLDQIYDAGLTAISPPPEHLVEFDQQKLRAVSGWLIGTALNRDQVDLARQQAAAAERLPQLLKRPLVGEALEQYWLYGRIANQVIVPSPDPISAGDTLEKERWLASTLDGASQQSESWVSVYAGNNPALADQYRTAVQRIQGQSDAPIPVNPLGLRMQVVSAVVAGTKGIVYRTDKPLLDPILSQASEDRAVQAAMRWTNADLQLWSPWIHYGETVAPPQTNQPDALAACWQVRDAKLVIIQNAASFAQLCAPATRHSPLQITMQGALEPHEVLRLTEGRMEIMQLERTASTDSWRVDAPNAIEHFVITANPQVKQFLRQRLQRHALETASDQLEVANYGLQQASELVEARFRVTQARPVPEQSRQISSQQQRVFHNQTWLETGWQALANQQPENATSIALQSIDQTQAILGDAYQAAISNLATPQSSPFVLAPGMLKYHWLVADACARANWQPLSLPGSDFENLDRMLENGWSQQRRLEDQVDLRVELVPPTEAAARSLRLAAYPKQQSSKSFETVPGGYEGASLRVRSAPAAVKRGQLIRVVGTAVVRFCGTDPAAGLLVYDNQAWTSMGQLVRGQPGQRVPIELYRFVTQDGEFRLLAECRGLCDIQLEGIQASVIEPATDRQSYDTTPLLSVDDDSLEFSESTAQASTTQVDRR